MYSTRPRYRSRSRRRNPSDAAIRKAMAAHIKQATGGEVTLAGMAQEIGMSVTDLWSELWPRVTEEARAAWVDHFISTGAVKPDAPAKPDRPAPPRKKVITDEEGFAALAELAADPRVLTGISSELRQNIVSRFEALSRA